MVNAADAVPAGQLVDPLDQGDAVHLAPVDSHGNALLKADLDISGLSGVFSTGLTQMKASSGGSAQGSSMTPHSMLRPQRFWSME